jgi:hypothetical protein
MQNRLGWLSQVAGIKAEGNFMLFVGKPPDSVPHFLGPD